MFINVSLIAIVVLGFSLEVTPFTLIQHQLHKPYGVDSRLHFSQPTTGSGKGFGKVTKPEPVAPKPNPASISSLPNNPSSATSTSSSTNSIISNADELNMDADESMKSRPSLISDNDNRNLGDSKLSNNANDNMTIEETIQSTKMFKTQRQNRLNLLDDKIQKLKEEEDLIATDPSVGAVPELVANRMLGRIIAFFGIPVFGGLSIFVGAFFVSKKYDLTLPPAIIAYATQFPFVLGLIGISYAILSSSWDEEPGSLLGIDEFKINFKRIQDGLERTRDTAALREDIETESAALLNKGGNKSKNSSRK